MNEVVTLPQRLTPAQQALIVEPASEKLVRRVVTVFCANWPIADPDEVASLAREAMVLAAPHYRPGPLSFAGYVQKRVAGHVLDGLRRDLRARVPTFERILRQYPHTQPHREAERTRAADAPSDARARVDARMARVAFDLYLSATLVPESPEAILSARQEQARADGALRGACAELGDLERAVIERHYFDQVELKALVGELGASYATLKRVHRRALDALRRSLARHDVTAMPHASNG